MKLVKKTSRATGRGKLKIVGAQPAADTIQTSTNSGGGSVITQPTPASESKPGNPPAAKDVYPGRGDITKLTTAKLAVAINGSHRCSESSLHTARQHTEAALKGALQAGACLVEVHRRETKTGWGSWVEKHCPELPISTAYRYMSLARKFPHVRTGEVASLRQAYIAVGILPDAAPKTKKAPDLGMVPTPSGTDLAARIKSAWTFFGTEIEQVNVAALAEPFRLDLQNQLTALLTSLNDLLARLTTTPLPAPEIATTAGGKEEA